MIHTLVLHCRSAAVRSAAMSLILSLLLLPSLSGCALFIQALQSMPVTDPPKYKNLAGQSVAVMVWSEENGVRVEWPQIHLDVARMIQAKFQHSQKTDKPDELKLTRFPVSAASVARFQEEHPEFAALSIEEIAPKLGVTRVIYVELHGFQTRPDQANDLFRGTVSGTVRVIEVSNGVGRVAFSDDNTRVTFPRISPDEGMPGIGDTATYNGTLDGFATEVVKLFVPHANDPDNAYGSNNDAVKQ
jgi:hypothetical protein